MAFYTQHGMLLATQYDISWREDLFDAWDFYDISQSFEFRKAGHRVVVPHQEEPWCMHDCGRLKLQDYNIGRKRLLEEYAVFFKNPCYKDEDFVYNPKVKTKIDQLSEQISVQLESGHLGQARELFGVSRSISSLNPGVGCEIPLLCSRRERKQNSLKSY